MKIRRKIRGCLITRGVEDSFGGDWHLVDGIYACLWSVYINASIVSSNTA